MTLAEAFEMIDRGETPEEYKKRLAKIRRLSNERDFLADAIDILDKDDLRRQKKVKRLEKVLDMIEALRWGAM